MAEAMAERELAGVGDSALGEWREFHTAFHIRRRLSKQEQETYGLTMIDMRGTGEGKQRIAKLLFQHPRLRKFAEMEFRNG